MVRAIVDDCRDDFCVVVVMGMERSGSAEMAGCGSELKEERKWWGAAGLSRLQAEGESGGG